ncbi:uncharacterized protein LOC130430312 isoform X2 [Triplophysa dalaica]|uniref:uncharacterized protein LOC130430312 isoform X2 n=1 Tax=Triplophysa dalaica TaxID=1582913 RepID=UPI0024DF8CA6|nr:uncharacterized protein LOC130430312 isoform X2 [Triplophysa dalaica]
MTQRALRRSRDAVRPLERVRISVLRHSTLVAQNKNINMNFLIIFFCSLLILSGVFGDTDEVKVSVKEGDSFTLKIKPDDINRATELVWWSNDTKIAKIDLEVKDRQPKYTDERFRDRLNMEHQTGSLTITNIRSEDSGEYKLEIKSSSDIKYKTFRVSVSESSSHWRITGPVLAVILLLLVGVSYVLYKRYRKQKSKKEEKDTVTHLKNDEE